jgi:hypothetical protein
VLHPGEFPVLALFGHSPFIRRAYSAFRSRSTLRSQWRQAPAPSQQPPASAPGSMR